MTGDRDHNREDELNLFELVAVIKRRRWLIASVILFFFASSAVISLILPNKYAATAKILPPQQEGSMSSSLLSQLPGGFGAIAGQFLGGKSQVDVWLGILNSRTVKDAVIDKFGLMEAFNCKTMERARKKLSRNVYIIKSEEEILSVTVMDKDPVRAAGIANAYVDELDRINKTIDTTSGSRMKDFVEKRLDETRRELEMAELRLRDFQQVNRAVKLDDQSRVIIERIGSLKAEIAEREVELQTLLSYATTEHYRVQLLATTISELKRKLGDLEKGSAVGGEEDIAVSVSDMPELNLQYLRLMREFKAQQAVFEFLAQQYEIARLKIAKDQPTIQVLDEAVVPELKASPKRVMIVLVATFVGTVLAVASAFIKEFAVDLKN